LQNPPRSSSRVTPAPVKRKGQSREFMPAKYCCRLLFEYIFKENPITSNCVAPLVPQLKGIQVRPQGIVVFKWEKIKNTFKN
jgi:hypothetical protein